MKRKQGLAALVAGAVIGVALLAVFAVELSDNQAKSRRSLETQAHQRAQLVAGLVDTVFQAISQPAPALLATYGQPRVPDSALQRNRGGSLFLALLAPSGRVLAHSSGFTAQAAATIATPGAVSAVQHGKPWYLGDSSPYGSTGVIDFATWLHTSAGRRILLTGFRPSGISGFVAAELAKIPGAQGHHSLVVDGDKTVIASTNPLRPPGYRFHTKAQLTALSTHSGVVHSSIGVRYFDQVPLGNTSWKIILSLPASEFFASVSGVRHDLPWVIFVAFGLVALGALLLVRRAIRSSERIRLTNDALTQSNVELNSAHARLEEAVDDLAVANDALERSNDELERQAQELVRSNTELDQFASIASHDLQEPLRKVRTFTERITESEGENLSERGADYLRRANASAERMQTLIEDLLRFSRVSTQGQPFSPVDLSRITADVIDDLSDQVSRAGARIEVGPLPTLNADGPQMRQLMQNLISNALKFSREGVEPVVRIDSTLESGWATITVADNGIGFDPQYSRRIFRVFERLHGRSTYPGTGIGLALCRKIAERHGGTVVADGVLGEGATFTVTMQTQRTEAVSEGMAQRRPAPASAGREEHYVTVA
jgi:signal transduction histidine kinase